MKIQWARFTFIEDMSDYIQENQIKKEQIISISYDSDHKQHILYYIDKE